jgi:hypothetical protein
MINAKTSEFVPEKLFKDLFYVSGRSKKVAVDENEKPIFKDPINGPDELKRRIFKNYNVNINSLLFINQLIKTPPQDGILWNAIVMPKGDGDNAAQRLDVRRSFLLQH